MSRIIEYINPSFPNKKWYKCTIGNITHSSPIRKNVEDWRDDRMVNSDYYNELELLNQQQEIATSLMNEKKLLLNFTISSELLKLSSRISMFGSI